MKKPKQDQRLLVIGGDADPNLKCLSAAAERAGVDFLNLFVGQNSHPALAWEVNEGRCILNGDPLECTAAFIRHDVFTGMADGRPSSQYRSHSWFSTLNGWLASNEEIKIFNRKSMNQVTNKPHVLGLARGFGLKIPHTIVTNDFSYIERLDEKDELVVKPVNGGGYCQEFREVAAKTHLKEGRAASPAIIQNKLVQPEVRIYVAGKKFFAFNMVSDELDYRATQKCRVEHRADPPGQLLPGYKKLVDRLGLDFAAADFKTDEKDGDLRFLEINTGPMFAAFDVASEGLLCDSMIAALTGNPDRKS